MNDKQKVEILAQALYDIVCCFTAAASEGLFGVLYSSKDQFESGSLANIVMRRLCPIEQIADIALRETNTYGSNVE